MIKKWVISLILWAILLNAFPSTSHAQEAIVCDLDVIVQRDDWLSKLSEKFYGDVLAFPAIAEATNAKTVVDPTYAVIANVDLIEPGWKLCIVNVSKAEEILGFELDSAPIADNTPENLGGVIKIGAAQALSGPFAEQGQSIRNGIDLAVKDINQSKFLGEGVLEVIWEDTAGNKEQAAQAFTKLINEDQVVAILGPTLSKSAFAADPIAQAAGVPIIGSSNTAEGVTDIGNYIFRTNLPENVIIANTINRLKDDLQLQRVSMIYNRSNTFTQSSQAAFAQALSEAEIEIISTIAFTSGDSDFSARLAEIKGLGPDAIILNTLADEAATIMLQARQVGIPENVRFIGSNSINSPGFLALGGDIINGVIFGAAWNVGDISGANRKFVADYTAEYGHPPDQFAAQSYTAVKVLAAALRSADSLDRAAIRDALDTVEFVESPLGLFTFDDERNASHPTVVQVVENGRFVIFQ
jgi:branched-chain amino acid transport system substrate-binding protein